MFTHVLTDFSLRRSDRRRSRQPMLEILETRCVPTTLAILGGSTLYVTNNGGNQQITITELSSGSYRLQASDLPAGPKTFQGVQSMNVTTGTGNDTVTLNGGGGPALASSMYVIANGGLTLTNNNFNVYGQFVVTDSSNANVKITLSSTTSVGQLSVYGNNGNYTVTLQAGAVVNGLATILLGNGANAVTLQQGAVVNGTLSITAGSGTNNIVLTGVQVGYTSQGGINLNLGAAANTVTLTGTTVNGSLSVAYLAGGTVTLSLQNCKVHGYVTAAGGSAINAKVGSCTIDSYLKFVTNATAGGSLNDSVAVTNSHVGAGFIFASGPGNFDGVDLFDCTIAGNSFISGSATGTVSILNSTLNGGLTVDYSQATTPIYITLNSDTITGGLALTTGAGNDDISILGTRVGQPGGTTPTIQTGGGNDTVQLGASGQPTIFYPAGAKFDGGPGNDKLILTFAQFPGGRPIITNFETVQL